MFCLPPAMAVCGAALDALMAQKRGRLVALILLLLVAVNFPTALYIGTAHQRAGGCAQTTFAERVMCLLLCVYVYVCMHVYVWCACVMTAGHNTSSRFCAMCRQIGCVAIMPCYATPLPFLPQHHTSTAHRRNVRECVCPLRVRALYSGCLHK